MGPGKKEDQKTAGLNIRILHGAEADLAQGARFYESQAPGLGTYFLDSLFSDIDALAYFGRIHPLYYGFHRLLSKRFPLLLITV